MCLVVASTRSNSGPEVAKEGVLAEKTIGCVDADTLDQAQHRANVGDVIGVAQLAGRCHLFQAGDRWRMIERSYGSSLLYVTKFGVPHRVYVRNAKLAL